MRKDGHEVICITARFPNIPIRTGMPCEIYYTCGQLKSEWAEDNGVNVDVWIDDTPACIGGSVLPPQAKQRREIIKQLWDQLQFGSGT